ncbi:MAG: translation initiation factor IF-2 [Chlamydiae bacterium]|nr:translation initiation factor IF-2 [Chlamydiota bacterium]
MAKNLKINVKNSQLSQVLKGIRQKKGEPSETLTKDNEIETKTVESQVTEKPAPKKVSRAKKAVAPEAKETPVTFDEPAIEKTKPIIESHPKEERLSQIEKEIFKEEVSEKSFEDEVPTKTDKPASSFEPRAQRSIEPQQRTTRPGFSSDRTSKPSGFQPKSMSFEKPADGYTRSSHNTGPRDENSDQRVSGRAEPRFTSSYSTERRYTAPPSNQEQSSQGTAASDQARPYPSERRSYPPREGDERRSYPPREGSERGSYPPREGDERRSYPPREGGERRPYPPREGGERGSYPPREGGERRPYPPREGGERSSYPPREGGERRPYPPREGGERSSYPPGEGGERRPYPPREGGERRPYPPREGGERRPYPPREGGERRPYPPREGGERSSYPPREGGERRPYPPREGGERRPYPPREGGERRPYPPREGGERRPYPPREGAERGSYPPREGGERRYPPREGGRPGFGPRPQGARPPFQRPSFVQGANFPPVQAEPGSRRSLPPTKKGLPLKDEEKKKRRLNEPSKHFDSRDRHGLRDDEDEFHRRKFKTHIAKSNAAEEILRPKAISVTLPISVKDLAAEMKLKAVEVIAKLLTHGIKCMLNDMLDDEVVVQLVGQDFGCDISIDTSKQDRMDITGKSILEEITASEPDQLASRPPVVTFMGHVDHGKTSLIDALRKSNLTSKEAGAITQHIGAFSCHTANGDITILDTPGHEAFTTIRSRGASVTDIVVLVVAGDEGFKVQTDEAIRIAKEAKLPMIFAINKMDKEGFDPEKVYRQMADRELLPEAWGGEVPTVNCSALTGEGISELSELLALQSEILELKANPQSRARGTVLESQIIKGLGPSATLLIQNGTLRISDAIVFGQAYARVKTIQDEHQNALKSAGPSHAVRVTGLSDVPPSGSDFIVVKSEKEARKICEQREAESRKSRLRKQSFNLGSMLQANATRQEKKIFNVIVKADVQGSLEAIKDSLLKIPTEKVLIQFVSEGLGMITLTDAELAMTSNAVIFGFHTKTDKSIESFVRTHKIKIHHHDVIYHLVDDAKELMTQLLDKLRIENEMAEVEVRATFKASNLGVIAGCMVTSGTVKRNHIAKVYRNSEIVFDGEIQSLKRVKEDVKEVQKGLECGILFKGYNDVQVGDIVKTFEVQYIQQEL